MIFLHSYANRNRSNYSITMQIYKKICLRQRISCYFSTFFLFLFVFVSTCELLMCQYVVYNPHHVNHIDCIVEVCVTIIEIEYFLWDVDYVVGYG